MWIARYLKDRRIPLLCVLLCGLLIPLIFSLYQLPFNAVIDILAWQGLLAAALLAFDLFQWRKKHTALSLALEKLASQLIALPSPTSQIEEDYQALLMSLDRKVLTLSGEIQQKSTELGDYYTLWVHQIKVPLSAIDLLLQKNELSGYANDNSDIDDTSTESLDDLPAPEHAAFPVAELREELSRIDHYTDMLLHYLRLESLSSDLLFKPYTLSSIVHDAVRKHRDSFIRKKLPIELNLPEMQVTTDRKWLLFILEQLLSNALKYTHTGQITISADKPSNTLTIEDTGIGIPAEDLPRLRERGFTGYNGRAHRKASGLGLYMCQKIADRLSITITIFSRVGSGTSVTLTFPERVERVE